MCTKMFQDPKDSALKGSAGDTAHEGQALRNLVSQGTTRIARLPTVDGLALQLFWKSCHSKTPQGRDTNPFSKSVKTLRTAAREVLKTVSDDVRRCPSKSETTHKIRINGTLSNKYGALV